MSLAKCPRCKNLFNKSSTLICMGCAPDEEADYEKIKECLRNNSELSPEAISEQTGVDLECVMRMVEQGLVSSGESGGHAKCGRCGAPAISASKRLCSNCLEDLNRQMTQQRKEIQLAPRKPAPGSQHRSVRQTLEAREENTK